jgi:hypothetical protein
MRGLRYGVRRSNASVLPFVIQIMSGITSILYTVNHEWITVLGNLPSP